MESFNKTYPLMKHHLLKKIDRTSMVKELEELLNYQVPYGRQTRAAIVVSVHEIMNPQSDSTEYNALLPFQVMAWIVELYQAATLLIDDIVDASTYRRSKLAWHIGRERLATCHAGFLFSSSRLLMLDYLRDMPYFKTAMKLLEDHIFKTFYMEAYDLHILESIRKKNVSMDFYRSYTIDKSIYSTELPFKLAFYAATNEVIDFDENVENIFEDLTYEMQILNDVMEFFSKIYNGKDRLEDIKKGNLTWTLVYVMENASEEDVNIITRNYGIEDDRCAERVLHIFNKFDWKEKCLAHEKELVNSINERIKMIPHKKVRAGLEVTQQIICERYPSTNPNNEKFAQ